MAKVQICTLIRKKNAFATKVFFSENLTFRDKKSELIYPSTTS